MLAIFLAAALAPAAPVTLPEPAELRRQIEARDAALFAAVFGPCAPDRMRAFLTDDIEFYHDRDGLSRGAEAFMAGYRRNCAQHDTPGAFHSRRVLVPESLTVDPVPGVGAIETGEHLFYERQGDGPEHLAGRARFAQLWVLAPDGWRLSRVFSYGHQAAH